MKVTRLPGSRTLHFTELEANQSGLTDLEVCLQYRELTNEGSRVQKAVCLDNVIIPAIIAAVNDHYRDLCGVCGHDCHDHAPLGGPCGLCDCTAFSRRE